MRKAGPARDENVLIRVSLIPHARLIVLGRRTGAMSDNGARKRTTLVVRSVARRNRADGGPEVGKP